MCFGTGRERRFHGDWTWAPRSWNNTSGRCPRDVPNAHSSELCLLRNWHKRPQSEDGGRTGGTVLYICVCVYTRQKRIFLFLILKLSSAHTRAPIKEKNICIYKKATTTLRTCTSVLRSGTRGRFRLNQRVYSNWTPFNDIVSSYPNTSRIVWKHSQRAAPWLNCFGSLGQWPRQNFLLGRAGPRSTINYVNSQNVLSQLFQIAFTLKRFKLKQL